jgi:uncharacterized protein YndB with AHSA1/START domain
MNGIKGNARAVADTAQGGLIASVELAAPPERVFRALVSKEVTGWWVRPGVFDTREWTGDVHAGGRWCASGIGGGQPYTLEGEFLEVDPPRKLVHTWHRVGTPNTPTTVTYHLERLDDGTRITLRHTARDVHQHGDRLGDELRAAGAVPCAVTPARLVDRRMD